jgi:transposase-like protein
MDTELPETLQEAIGYFADEGRAFEFMKAVRWPDGIARCNRCSSDNVLFMAKQRRWKCRECKGQFSVKVGTAFEDSPLGLDKWLPAFWIIVNAKNGCSSCELGRALGITQKSAWFMLHRLRLAIHDGSVDKMSGQVEADETYIGGKARNMHTKDKKRKGIVGNGMSGKTAVAGLLERGKGKKASRVVVKVAETVKKGELQSNVREYVLKGAEIHTDSLLSYDGLSEEYTHNVINHAESYVRGHVHTNGMENFWSLLKRALKGTYVSVEPFHLFRYLDEQAFRFNERKDNDLGRFLKGIVGVIGKRIMYKHLIGAEETGADGLPAGA